MRRLATKGEVPMIGKIYQVRDVADRRCPVTGRTWQGLRLVGIVLAVPGHPDAYAQVEAFRPIYRPSADFIESLKQPSPAREPEHA
jgi:hypothetical protein